MEEENQIEEYLFPVEGAGKEHQTSMRQVTRGMRYRDEIYCEEHLEEEEEEIVNLIKKACKKESGLKSSEETFYDLRHDENLFEAEGRGEREVIPKENLKENPWENPKKQQANSLFIGGFTFIKNRIDMENKKIYWGCEHRKNKDIKCNATAITDLQNNFLNFGRHKTHKHEPHDGPLNGPDPEKKIVAISRYGLKKKLKASKSGITDQAKVVGSMKLLNATSELERLSKKCRCCLSSSQNQIFNTIDNEICEKFFELTKIQLKSSEKYSNFICHDCNMNLDHFSSFQQQMVSNQEKLYRLENETEELNPVETQNVKIEEEELVEIEMDHSVKTSRRSEPTEIDPEPLDFPSTLHDTPQSNLTLKRKNKHSRKKELTSNTSLDYGICEYCAKPLNSDFRRHIRAHIFEMNNTPFLCDLCDYRTFTKKLIFSHMKKHNTEKLIQKQNAPKPFVCSFCPKTFEADFKRRVHENDTHAKKDVYCECGSVFRSLNNLKAHRRVVHRTGEFPCSHCDRVFETKCKLNGHVKKHLPKVPCEVCGFLVSIGQRYKDHVRTHGPPSFICTEEGCNKGFQRKWKLKNHIARQHRC